MLTLKNISKSFQQRGLVIDTLNFEISEGETVSIMGPSGSGKTTLLNIMALLDKPDSGDLLFKGDHLQNYNQDESAAFRNRNLGFVFQEHHMLPYLTIYQNIILPVMATKHSDRELDEINAYAAGLVEKIGISSILEKYPSQVSGGEAQRATIIRALINKPFLILADEPTGALDTRNGELLADLLLEMNRETGVTLVIATHSSHLAGRMGRNLVLKDGRLYPQP